MRDHAARIHRFLRESQGKEMEYRVMLSRLRDYAAALLANTASPKAAGYARNIHETAGYYLFANASLFKLENAVACCRLSLGAAMRFEILESEEAA